jgi:uncharacterized ferritin-like protein (DUF455 family)
VSIDIFALSLQALNCCDVSLKQSKVAELSLLINRGDFACDSTIPVAPVADPGRPCLPVLVHPSQVPRRRLGSAAGRAGLIHAIAHIEFNAVNLALDAIYRFRRMPPDYYRDWIRVASEEAVHFQLLNNRLRELSSYYGSMPAHGGMWMMAVETDYDVMVRMALVPRVLEARGLDVTPGMISKLSDVGDTATVAILERILAEEVDHVRIGNRWFKALCDQRGLDALDTFSRLLRKHGRIALRGPFNRPARLQAGFSEAELAEIAELEREFKSQLLEHS